MSESLREEENRITIMLYVIIECHSHGPTRHYTNPKVLIFIICSYRF